MKVLLMKTGCIIVLIGIVLSYQHAHSNEAWDSLFDKEFIADFESGDSLNYEMSRRIQNEEDSKLQLQVLEEGKLQLVSFVNGRERKIGEFSNEIGNPVALYFLEEVVRTMSKLTKGSPFYIRNRIKESIMSSEFKVMESSEAISSGRVMQLNPFHGNENQIQMGGFANLSIRAVVSKEIPGGIFLLEANTPEGDENDISYSSSVVFKEMEEKQ